MSVLITLFRLALLLSICQAQIALSVSQSICFTIGLIDQNPLVYFIKHTIRGLGIKDFDLLMNLLLFC